MKISIDSKAELFCRMAIKRLAQAPVQPWKNPTAPGGSMYERPMLSFQRGDGDIEMTGTNQNPAPTGMGENQKSVTSSKYGQSTAAVQQALLAWSDGPQTLGPTGADGDWGPITESLFKLWMNRNGKTDPVAAAKELVKPKPTGVTSVQPNNLNWGNPNDPIGNKVVFPKDKGTITPGTVK